MPSGWIDPEWHATLRIPRQERVELAFWGKAAGNVLYAVNGGLDSPDIDQALVLMRSMFRMIVFCMLVMPDLI